MSILEATNHTTTNSERGQVNTDAAEVYEAFFVPALFQEWAERIVIEAQLQPGQTVLDVACGTGVLTRAIAERVGDAGQAIGLDINEGMLAVAEQKASHIQWHRGAAESLPFENNRFDAVVSQFGLMFFEDRQTALQEMMRVLQPGGQLAVAVWDTVENTPGYAKMIALLQQLFGQEAANGLRAPYNLGDISLLKSIFDGAGIVDISIITLEGTARFPSIDDWVYTDIKGWTLANMIDDGQFELLLAEANKTLRSFVQPDGTVAFKAPAHIVTKIK
ncbi:MAG: class I SAM-dependent methyltransferase [Chloroflexota bacterium]